MSDAKPPSGRRIWQAIRSEMEQNLYALPFTTVAPAVYHVYLHPDDFAFIEGIVPRLVAQAQRALNDEVQRRNESVQKRKARPWDRLLGGVQTADVLAAIELPPGGWEIYIQADRDGQLPRGHIGIESRLALPPQSEFDGGTPTTRIVKTVLGEGTRTSTATLQDATVRETGAARSVSATGYAKLTYTDDEGTHTFVMRKDEIGVGRGGTSAWVDVTIVTGAKVSREHFRLRRDRSGRFFIRDVSTWGTWVNGDPVPAAVKTADGTTQPGPERELPSGARIDLAHALAIDFTVDAS